MSRVALGFSGRRKARGGLMAMAGLYWDFGTDRGASKAAFRCRKEAHETAGLSDRNNRILVDAFLH